MAGQTDTHRNSSKRDDIAKTAAARTEDAIEHYEDMKESLKASSQEAKRLLTDTASEVGYQAKNMLNKASEEVKERSTHLRDALTQYVDEKPMTALGIAALAGLLLGVVLKK